MIQVSAPGKLYIAGEYAVIEPGYSAILVAVNQFINVSVVKAYEEGSISIYGSVPILWSRESNRLVFNQKDNRILYIKEAINIVEEYANEFNKNLNFYNIKVNSDLETDEGIKYGLGSSAAVTVATIIALLKFYEISTNNETIFKLAALATLSVNKNSSFGDIAASVYGGWIAYTTFDKEWVIKQRRNFPLTKLIDMKWKYLSIESLMPPEDLRLAVGWTGTPASTARIVEEFNKKIYNKDIIYKEFLSESKICVNNMIKAFKNQDIVEIQEQLTVNRELLARLSEALGLVIETPLLAKLCSIAIKYGGYAKSSGAGGGDCGIAIFKDNSNFKDVINEWEKCGITYLPIKVYRKEGEKFE